MSFEFKKKLPVPKEIKELYPVSSELAAKKKELDQQLIDVISGKSDKFLAIIGPCSADNEDSVCEYIERLTKVQEKIKDKVIIPYIQDSINIQEGQTLKSLEERYSDWKKQGLN